MLAGVGALGEETIELRDSLGRVLARDVVSPVSLPLWDNASMDGFAVRAADVRGASADRPVTLRVVETIAAGQRGTRVVGAGEAARIMTGAPLPGGADCVVRVEDTASSARRGRDPRRPRRGRERAAPRARTCAPARSSLRAGTTLGAAHVGVLASVGCARPVVHRRPRVGILATGDELVPLRRVRRGARRTRASCRRTLLARGRGASRRGRADRPSASRPTIRRSSREHLRARRRVRPDPDLRRRIGGRLRLHARRRRRRSAARSRSGACACGRARPSASDACSASPWLGLPGNPVSALVTFELFGRPLLRTLAGSARPHRRTVRVVLDEEIVLRAPLTHFLRCVLVDGDDGSLHARLTGAQSSGMLTSMSSADALLIVPPEPATVPAGSTLRAMPLDGDYGASAEFPA